MAGETSSDFWASNWGELKSKYNDLVLFVMSIQPLAGSGVLRNDSDNGRLLSVNVSGGGGDNEFAFGVSASADLLDSTIPKIRVNYGWVYDYLNYTTYNPSGMTTDGMWLSYPGSSGGVYLQINYTVDTDSGRGTIGSITVVASSGTIPTSDASDPAAGVHIISLGEYGTDASGSKIITYSANIGFVNWIYAIDAYWWNAGIGP